MLINSPGFLTVFLSISFTQNRVKEKWLIFMMLITSPGILTAFLLISLNHNIFMNKVKQNGLATHSNLREILVPDSKVHGAYMGPPGADRTQLGPMLAPWSLLSGVLQVYVTLTYICKFHILVSIQNIWVTLELNKHDVKPICTIAPVKQNCKMRLNKPYRSSKN